MPDGEELGDVRGAVLHDDFLAVRLAGAIGLAVEQAAQHFPGAGFGPQLQVQIGPRRDELGALDSQMDLARKLRSHLRWVLSGCFRGVEAREGQIPLLPALGALQGEVLAR